MIDETDEIFALNIKSTKTMQREISVVYTNLLGLH